MVALFSSVKTKAQCDIDIPNLPTDTIHICQGDQLTLTSSGDCADYLMSNDFNDGTIGSGWNSNASPMFNNPCGPCPPDFAHFYN